MLFMRCIFDLARPVLIAPRTVPPVIGDRAYALAGTARPNLPQL